jgi:hypothetical protein
MAAKPRGPEVLCAPLALQFGDRVGGALRPADPLWLRDRGEDRKHRIAEQTAGRERATGTAQVLSSSSALPNVHLMGYESRPRPRSKPDRFRTIPVRRIGIEYIVGSPFCRFLAGAMPP